MIPALNIYNIFPRLYDGVSDWHKAMLEAKNMGFNAVYLNAFNQCGESGSIYSVKDYYQFDPLSFPQNNAKDLMDFLASCKEEGMYVFMDLVINHTAIDSPLVTTFPDWFEKDGGKIKHAFSFGSSGEKITWHDSAKLDYSRPESDLWEYMLSVCLYYSDLGFTGFRCDASVYVDSEFWRYLIGNIKADSPETVFLAETFACSNEDIQKLAFAGFDYYFTSAKWWNYKDNWLLEQYCANNNTIASISFPENHDTKRLMDEVNKNKLLFMQRLLFTGYFSKGFMLTCGCEFGFTKALSVVEDVSLEKTDFDFREEITKMLDVKRRIPALCEDGDIYVKQNDEDILVIEKRFKNNLAYIVLNKTQNVIRFPYFDKVFTLEAYSVIAFEGQSYQIAGYSVVLRGKKMISIEHKLFCEPASDEVCVAVHSCGICGSDYHEYRNGLQYWPKCGTGGHEFCGVIDRPADGFPIGGRVVFQGNSGCGICNFCTTGRSHLCAENSLGAIPHGGGFARYAVVNKRNIVKLPDDIDNLTAVMIEPLAVAVHAANKLRGEKKIAIVGSGPIALLLENYLRFIGGDSEIMMFYKYENAKKYAIGETEHIGRLPNNYYDVLFDVSGQDPSEFLFALARGGRLIAPSLSNCNANMDFHTLMFRENTVEGCFLYTHNEYMYAMDIVNQINAKKLISHVFPLEHAAKAFAVPSCDRMKVIIIPSVR